MKRVTLIVNPRASHVAPASAREVERVLAEVADVATIVTERVGHATDLAEESDADAIVVFSGDGGFNEVLNGADGHVPLGFIPGGGTSVLPRALGIPRGALPAARRIADALRSGRTRRIALGRVNDRRFGFNAGVGIDAEVVRRVDALGRRADGRRPADLRFLWTLARVVAEHRAHYEPELELEGVGRAAFALVANADPYTYLGPFPVRLVPQASFERGLDLLAPESVGALEIPKLLGAAMLRRDTAPANIRYLHDVESIELRCDRPLPLQADGEDLGDVTFARFVAERDAVSVLV